MEISVAVCLVLLWLNIVFLTDKSNFFLANAT